MKNSLELFRGNRSPVQDVMSEFDQMFERAFRDPWSLLTESRPVEREWIQPRVDIEETGSAYLLSVDLPGVRKEDVKIDLSDNVLTISGERKREHEQKAEGVRRYERSYGRFQRSFSLPMTVDVNKVEANLEDGVLRVALPKQEASKPRSIQIQTGNRQGFFSKILGSHKSDEREAGVSEESRNN